jgi:hypothetical protein
MVVYGTRDPSLTAANLQVARALSAPPLNEGRWPVIADVDLSREDAAAHSLVLVGNARSHAYLSTIEHGLPLRVDADAVVVGEGEAAAGALLAGRTGVIAAGPVGDLEAVRPDWSPFAIEV